MYRELFFSSRRLYWDLKLGVTHKRQNSKSSESQKPAKKEISPEPNAQTREPYNLGNIIILANLLYWIKRPNQNDPNSKGSKDQLSPHNQELWNLAQTRRLHDKEYSDEGAENTLEAKVTKVRD